MIDSPPLVRFEVVETIVFPEKRLIPRCIRGDPMMLLKGKSTRTDLGIYRGVVDRGKKAGT